MRGLKNLLRIKSANMAVTFALATPALLGVAGAAVDFVSMSKKQSALQAVADAAVIAAAHELPLANSKPEIIKSTALQYVKPNLKAKTTGSKITTDVKVDDGFTGVKIEIREVWKPFFAHFVTDMP